MKLKKLNKALVAAGLVAGAAISMPSQAVILSDDGTGEVLIYPFYTVQGPTTAARTTTISVVNTRNEIKAVKVRFHEAHNSRDALDFNLYLSPNDVWTGVVSRNASGVAQLTTSDTSCTIPSSIQTGVSTFSTLAYTQTGNNDGGNQNALRTNEGYVEIIEMGVVNQLQAIDPSLVVGTGPLATATTLDLLGEAIIHSVGTGIPGSAFANSGVATVNAAGLPIGCEALQLATATTGVWVPPVNGGTLNNAHIAVTQPTGGLTGSALIIQSSLGTVGGYNAIALKHFYDVQSSIGATGLSSTPGSIACNAAIAAAAPAAAHDGLGQYCETGNTLDTGSLASSAANQALTTNRVWDDLHSFKDLDPSTANARSVQTYPNLAMAFPQISTIYDPDGGAAATTGVGTTTTLEWSNNEYVSTGITTSSTNVLFASVQDLQIPLVNATPVAVGGGALGLGCGGTDGVASAPLVMMATGLADCGNARPVSAVLARNNVINQYVLEQDASAGVDFRTDAVFTFPTKWYFSDNGLYGSTSDTVLDGTGVVVAGLESTALPPFSSQFVSSGTNRDVSCERFSINSADVLAGAVSGQLFDREEQTPAVTATGLVPSPAINQNAAQNFLCHEANVLTFNDGDLLSSRIANGLTATVDNSATGANSFNIDFPAGFTSGWFNVAFDSAGVHTMTSVVGPMAAGGVAPIATAVTAAGAQAVTGLPVVGFIVEGLVDGATAFDGNFTVGLDHKYQ